MDWIENFEKNAVCIVNGAAGIYVPKTFVTNFDIGLWNVNPGAAFILRCGPYFEDISAEDMERVNTIIGSTVDEARWGDIYWSEWDDVLQTAEYTSDDGRKWSLYQDDDLFAVPDFDER